jgi:hypothetical protein
MGVAVTHRLHPARLGCRRMTSSRSRVLQVWTGALAQQYAPITVDEAAGPEFRLAARLTAPHDPSRSPGGNALSGRWPVPDVRYLRTMINGVPVVTTPAEIDTTTEDELQAVPREATSGRHPAVVLDMTGTGFCDSAGDNTLLGAYQQLEEEGRDLP